MVGDINLSTKLNALACWKAIRILYVVSAVVPVTLIHVETNWPSSEDFLGNFVD